MLPGRAHHLLPRCLLRLCAPKHAPPAACAATRASVLPGELAFATFPLDAASQASVRLHLCLPPAAGTCLAYPHLPSHATPVQRWASCCPSTWKRSSPPLAPCWTCSTTAACAGALPALTCLGAWLLQVVCFQGRSLCLPSHSAIAARSKRSLTQIPIPLLLLRLLTTGEATESQRFYHAAFARLASRLTVPFEMLFAAASDSNCTASGGKDCGWSICTVAASGAASGGGSPALQPAPEDVAACHCESVFSLTQLVLSVLLPLLLLGCAEASQRRQFAACQLSVAAQREEAEGSRTTRRRRRRSGSTAWCISFDSMRLLALLALIQVRPACRVDAGIGGQLVCFGLPWAGHVRSCGWRLAAPTAYLPHHLTAPAPSPLLSAVPRVPQPALWRVAELQLCSRRHYASCASSASCAPALRALMAIPPPWPPTHPPMLARCPAWASSLPSLCNRAGSVFPTQPLISNILILNLPAFYPSASPHLSPISQRLSPPVPFTNVCLLRACESHLCASDK